MDKEKYLQIKVLDIDKGEKELRIYWLVCGCNVMLMFILLSIKNIELGLLLFGLVCFLECCLIEIILEMRKYGKKE